MCIHSLVRGYRTLHFQRWLPMLVLTIGALVLAPEVFADEGHEHASGTSGLTGAPLLWGLLSLAGIFALMAASRTVLARRVAPRGAGEGDVVGYFAAVRQFSRNARLFLTYSLLAELGAGIWSVMFNLYLLRVGFPITFVGTFWLVNMMCHGVAALPAGVIADRFGRRRSFFLATSISLLAQGTLLFTAEAGAILILAGVAGLGEAFHGVTGSPFMMDNSEAEERPHLFSLNSCFLQFSRFAGSLSGGLLPLALAAMLGVPPIDPSAARWALVMGLPLTLLALAPLAFMREKPVEVVEGFRELITLRNVAHFGLIGRFTVLSALVGIAFGLTIRFFNVFFGLSLNATDDQVSTILALGAVAAAGSVSSPPCWLKDGARPGASS